ncbi:MAG: GTP cyclohydrolase I FolE [SAR202 cluster bacterium]|nr:GTP cyclohydrolase I FolE [SAR202 cluster bacterium]
MYCSLKYGDVFFLVDQAKIKKLFREIISSIGENPDRDGLLKTPERLAVLYEELFSGLKQNPDEVLNQSFDEPKNSDMVGIVGIPFYSICEHHFLPFWGNVDVAYIPTNKIAGISKVVKVVEILSKRPQLQERLGTQIANCISNTLSPAGVGVRVEAEHMCMSMRGIKKPGTKVVTFNKFGLINEQESAQLEFYEILREK